MPYPQSIRTPELENEILDRIAKGQSLVSICKQDGFPNPSTFFDWLLKDENLANKYTRAREVQADLLAEETIDISDNGTNDWMESNDPKNKGYEVNGEHIQRSRLRVDARKWFASKVAPKKYGERTAVEHSGNVTHSLAARLDALDSPVVLEHAPRRLLESENGD